MLRRALRLGQNRKIEVCLQDRIMPRALEEIQLRRILTKEQKLRDGQKTELEQRTKKEIVKLKQSHQYYLLHQNNHCFEYHLRHKDLFYLHQQ